MKKTAIFYLIIIFIPLYSCRLHHDIALWKFTNWVYQKIDHPVHTKNVLMKSKVGLYGNGDHCDFKIFEARKYNALDKDKITKFYKDKFIETKEGRARISLYFPERFRKFTFDKQGQKWLTDTEKKTKDPIYILTMTFVYSNGWVIYPLIDPRCF